jgi:hypothetical protein
MGSKTALLQHLWKVPNNMCPQSIVRQHAGVMELVDIADLKSASLNQGVPVRVRPSAYAIEDCIDYPVRTSSYEADSDKIKIMEIYCR